MPETLLPKVVLILAVLTGFFLNINGFPLFDVDEGAFSQASREMLLHRDFVSISVNGEPRYDKPVLIYWLQAASAGLFGNHGWAYRLPSALASIGWTLTIFWFVRRLTDTRRAQLAALLMATTAQVTLIGKAATADALLNWFLCASLFHLYLYLQNRERNSAAWLSLFVALGTLTKGPIAIFLPAVVGGLFCLGERARWRRLFGLLADWRVWMIFLAVVLPWPILLYRQEGADFFREFLLVHNLGRFGGAMEGHGGGPLYYLIVLLIGFTPHAGLVLASLWRSRTDWRKPLSQFLLIWFGFVFVFFTLSATKLPHYLLYGSAALFVLMALHLDTIRQSAWLFLPQLLAAGALLALPFLLAQPALWQDEPKLLELLDAAPEAFGAGYIAFLIGFLLLSLWFALQRSWPLAYKQAASGIATSLFLAVWLLPAVAVFQQNSIKAAGELAAAYDNPLVAWRVNLPSFNLYAGRPGVNRAPLPGDLVLTRSGRLSDLRAHRVLYEDQGIALVGIEPFVPRYRTPAADG